MSREDFLTQRLLERSIELEIARGHIQRLQEERLMLDRRIHNQRVALRETWEIVEMRRNYMGSPASRAAFGRLLRRNKELQEEIRMLHSDKECLATGWESELTPQPDDPGQGSP